MELKEILLLSICLCYSERTVITSVLLPPLQKVPCEEATGCEQLPADAGILGNMGS